MKRNLFKWLDFKITNRCNNNCIYCGVKQDPPDFKDKLSADTISNALFSALNLSFSHFALLGGEPSLRKDFDIMLRPLQEGKRFDTLMGITNLLIFNDQMYEEIFKTNTNTAQIVVSFDNLNYPNYKNQDPKKILKYIGKIKEIAKNYSNLGERKVHIHTVISRENFDHILDHVNFFNKMGIDVSLALVEPFIIVNSKTKDKGYNIFTYDEIKLIIDQLKSLDEQKNLSWANKILLKYIEKYLNREFYNTKICTAGRSHIIIESNGYVYPCLTESYPKGLYFGNIKQEPFEKIYNKMNSFKCEKKFYQTCWDHFLWTALEDLYNKPSTKKVPTNSTNKNYFNSKNKKSNKLSNSNYQSNSKIINNEQNIIDPLDLPKKLVIEISAKCNLNCIMCGFNSNSNFYGEFMNSNLFDKIIENKYFFNKLEEIRLNGRGESTIHPFFISFLKKIRRRFKNCKITLFTNLMFPNFHIINEIMQNKVILFISVDGHNKDLYEKIRLGAKFNILLERLDYLRNYKNKYIVSTIQASNIKYLYNLAEFARDYKANIIFNVFRSDDIKIKNQFKKIIFENRKIIIEAFKKIRENIKGINILIPDQITGISIPQDLSNTISSASLTKCPNAHYEIMIAYNGIVYPCNMFNPYKLGDINKTSIKSIWNGFENRSFLKIYKSLDYCQNCSFLTSKEGDF
ncbi:MAG: radical SAM protein [Candidatus Helarchaeota archaeon]